MFHKVDIDASLASLGQCRFQSLPSVSLIPCTTSRTPHPCFTRHPLPIASKSCCGFQCLHKYLWIYGTEPQTSRLRILRPNHSTISSLTTPPFSALTTPPYASQGWRHRNGSFHEAQWKVTGEEGNVGHRCFHGVLRYSARRLAARHEDLHRDGCTGGGIGSGSRVHEVIIIVPMLLCTMNTVY